jgi:hypothetical protein
MNGGFCYYISEPLASSSNDYGATARGTSGEIPLYIQTIEQDIDARPHDLVFLCPQSEKRRLHSMRIMSKNKVVIASIKRVNKGFLQEMKKKIISAVAGGVMAFNLMTTQCFAATGTASVTEPLDNLKTLVIAVIGAVGVIILAKNVMEFAQAYQQQDSSTMNSALKGIVAGIMMAGISAVLTFLGF